MSSHENVEETPPPLLHVVKGDPSPEELAALVAVVSAMAGAAAEAAATQQRPHSAWSSPARRVRSVHRHGWGAWRSSGLPR